MGHVVRGRPFRVHQHRGLRAAVVVAVAVGVLTSITRAEAATSLRDRADARGFFIGTGVVAKSLPDSSYGPLVRANFNSVTPENEFKWDATEPTRRQFTFTAGDKVVAFAQAAGQRVRGLTLVWQSQMPAWVQGLNATDAATAMHEHITGLLTHYRGQVAQWDVVHEPLAADGSLRKWFLQQQLGDGYIADALRTARTADPNAKLFISDYDVEGVNAKSTALYRLAESLLAQGVPLDGVALQGHFRVGAIPADLSQNLHRFTGLGLAVELSQVDIRMVLPSDQAKLAQQAADYRQVVNVCLSTPRCTGLTVWGPYDGDSFVPLSFPGEGAPLLFDLQYQPKPAYSAVLSAFGQCCTMPTTTTTTTTTPRTTTTTAGPTTTTTTTTTTTATTATCSARYVVSSSWSQGFVAAVTVTAGAAPLTGWRVTMTLPSGVVIGSLWNGLADGRSGTVQVANDPSNGRLAAGASTGYGFLAGGGAGQGVTLVCTPA